jgi:hypothetical protein
VATRIRVLRGTRGRLTGWTVHCQDHGYVEKPTPTKRAAEAIAKDHALVAHAGNVSIETPAP